VTPATPIAAVLQVWWAQGEAVMTLPLAEESPFEAAHLDEPCISRATTCMPSCRCIKARGVACVMMTYTVYP